MYSTCLFLYINIINQHYNALIGVGLYMIKDDAISLLFY